jgi:hypothetical protein
LPTTLGFDLLGAFGCLAALPAALIFNFGALAAGFDLVVSTYKIPLST